MNNRATYLYEIPDGDGVDGKTTIRIVNDGKAVYIEVNRIRITEKSVGIRIEDRAAIKMLQAAMNE